MSKFKYFAPYSLPEASALLIKFGPEAAVISGGTDLMIKMRNKQIAPRYIIDLRQISGLDFIRLGDTGLSIGSRTTMATLCRSSAITKEYIALKNAARVLGSRQIRSIATLGGNLCNAAPSAEIAPPLLILGAQAQIYNPEGGRSIPLEQFFVSPSKTCIQQGEILESVFMARPEPGVYTTYCRNTTRKAMDIAVIGVSILLKVGKGQIIRQAKIALGAVAPTPILVPGLEDVLVGHSLKDNVINRASELAAACCKPINDLRSSAEYRREMVQVYVKRALIELKQQFD